MSKAPKKDKPDVVVAAVEAPNPTGLTPAATNPDDESSVEDSAPIAAKTVEVEAPVEKPMQFGLDKTKHRLQDLNNAAQADFAKRSEVHYQAAQRAIARAFNRRVQ